MESTVALKAALRKIDGPWDAGWVLDKHSLSSTPIGTYPNGRTMFDTKRSEVGEATFQLKYRSGWDQVSSLAETLVAHIYPKLTDVGFIVPMPASTARQRQPVTEVAQALGKLVNKPVIESLAKAVGGQSLKDLHSKEEKMAAIGDSFSIVDSITNEGRWNVLMIDDLFDTGASMEAACKALRGYAKVNRIYVAALTWK